jgi:hopene-associated glycosyltransferase HpnB
MLTALALLSLAAWIYLLFFHHGFWRADQRLPHAAANLPAWPSVVALVPARNEAASIGACVAALTAQDYKGAFRVVVIDDASTDGTGDIARAHSCEVITAPPLETGWTGKLGALNAGMIHVGDSAAFIWLTDADIVHPPETLSQLVAKAEMDQRDLVSLMVKLRCVSFWERLLIPAFVFFFQMLYPFPAANDDRSHIAAAAGGCVLVRRAALERAGGLAAIRGEIIDDCALARIIKRSGGKIWLGLADGSRSLRAADTLAPLWTMVRRTAFTQLRHSPLLLAGTVLGLTLLFLVPPLALLATPWHGSGLATLAGFLAWAGMTAAYLPTLRDYRRNPWQGLLLPGAATLYGAMTVASGVAHWRHRGGQWKGRYYGPSAARRNLSESS